MPAGTASDQSVSTQGDDHQLFAKHLAETEFRSFIKKRIVNKFPEGHSFLCPISHEVMQDPVTTEDGFTFDFESIRQCLNINSSNPLTRGPLTPDQLARNIALKEKIDSWMNEEPTSVTGTPCFHAVVSQLQAVHSCIKKRLQVWLA